MNLNWSWKEKNSFSASHTLIDFTAMIIKSRLFTCSYFKRWGWNILCCIKCALRVHKLLTSEVGKSWKCGLRRNSRKCNGTQFPEKKNVVWAKYEDKWAEPRAALFHTTCSDSYLSSWPAGLDQAFGREGAWRKKRSAITFSITARWHVETALWNLWWYKADQEITADILPYLVLKREAWRFTWCSLFISRLFFFFLTSAPLFSPRWPSHRKWAANCVLCNLSWYAGEMIKEETDRAISEAPGPVSCCSRAGKAPGLWRGNSSVREQ